MSIEDLEAHVWSRLSLRKHAAGRDTVGRLVRRIVRRWPSVLMRDSAMSGNQAIVMEGMRLSVERGERSNVTMGIFLTIILSALISEVIKIILAWWRSSASKQQLLAQYQYDMDTPR